MRAAVKKPPGVSGSSLERALLALIIVWVLLLATLSGHGQEAYVALLLALLRQL